MHRWSRLFIPTLREAPSDAEVASHKFLLRAGYVRQLGAGIYSYLFLGQRSLLKITNIVRQEMDRIGQEFQLPALLTREPWEESGRWTTMGDNMFRLKDRKGADLCLGMTHEEIMTTIARSELRSYKQLPQIWYQIQTKFTMKDSYSFDLNEGGLDDSYTKHDAAYRKIFTRCGLSFVAVDADSGAMGGSKSQEFMVYTDAGEDLIASCAVCGYAANMEKATSKLAVVTELEPTGDGLPELVDTPGKASIADVAAFFGILPAQDIKCVAYMGTRNVAGDKKVEFPVAAFLRGDHMVNETKLMAVTGTSELRPMTAEELEKYLHGPGGYLGPVGLSPAKQVSPDALNVILDRALEGRHNLVCGANLVDRHYRNVTPGRDFGWTAAADIRNVVEGEGCPECAEYVPLKVARAVEIGHIFKLGTRYTESMGAHVLDPNGKEVTPIMGCYGIGMERILTSAIEQAYDANGFSLPRAIAPFDVIVTVTNTTDPKLMEAGEKVAASLEEEGFDVLLDDRDERAGVKFKDADLIGVPYRINIGKKVVEGRAELVTRATLTSEDVALEGLVARLQQVTLTGRGNPGRR